MRYFIWGLGAVGSSFLDKLIENGLFDPQFFYCVDCSEEAKSRFLSFGGIDEHFTLLKIKENNYLELLKNIKKDDFLLDFTTDVKNIDILTYCLKHNIHYLSTADSSWNPDPLWISDHQHYVEYVRIKKENQQKQNTCVIQFGMNPGLVSCFAKKCLREIVDKDQSAYIKKHRTKLKEMLKEGAFGHVAKKIGVTDIQEVDNDTHETKIPFEMDTCYSTWNVSAYYYETVSSPELAFGDKERYFGYDKVYDCDAKDMYLALYKSGFEYPAMSYSPQGMVTGHISTHEEVFSIRRFFTYGKYKPTVHFLYSPCDYAIKSVENFKFNPPEKMHLITKEEILGGGESVGIIIQGKNFKSRYFGNFLNSNEIKESATILQVSASAYAAFVYMQKHPNEGMLFPEEMNENELLKTTKIYLKDYISVECPKIRMTLGKGE